MTLSRPCHASPQCLYFLVIPSPPFSRLCPGWGFCCLSLGLCEIRAIKRTQHKRRLKKLLEHPPCPVSPYLSSFIALPTWISSCSSLPTPFFSLSSLILWLPLALVKLQLNYAAGGDEEVLSLPSAHQRVVRRRPETDTGGGGPLGAGGGLGLQQDSSCSPLPDTRERGRVCRLAVCPGIIHLSTCHARKKSSVLNTQE